MFSLKSILFYIVLFCIGIIGNHLYYTANDDTPFSELSGDFSKLGVSVSVPIVAYTASWCDACKELKTYLSVNNIEYKNVDIEEDKTAMKRLQKFGVIGVPVIIIKDNLIQGFNSYLLNKYLLEMSPK